MKKLTVVGMGPGEYESMTLRAVKALNTCDVIVGYTVYVELAKPYFPDKEFLTTPMKREIERCEMAFAEAEKGRSVVMICSGDAGIYGMGGTDPGTRGEAPGGGDRGDPGDHGGSLRRRCPRGTADA